MKTPKVKKQKKKCPFIVIDGADGSGKGTQVSLLVERLRSEGYKVAVFDFPMYDTHFGKIVGRALKGKFGDFLKLDPHIGSMPYTLDRVAAKPVLELALSKNDFVICNRYTPSNIAYQAAKLRGKKALEFIEYMEKSEYEVLGLPKPDLILYLSVATSISFKLIEEKSKRDYLGKKGARDMLEANLAYQRRVSKQYKMLAKRDPISWKVVDCMRGKSLMTREEIAQVIYSTLNPFL
jgi:dTMP kinase